MDVSGDHVVSDSVAEGEIRERTERIEGKGGGVKKKKGFYECG